MKIQYENDTELAEFEAFYKEYRRDIVGEIGEKKYRIYATTITRLIQDYETESKLNGFFQVEPNLIIVDTVTKETIEKTINNLAQCKYFDSIDNLGFYGTGNG